MKKDSTHINAYRVTEGEGATNDADGLNGNFTFKLKDAIVQVSFAGDEIPGWEHAVAVCFDKPSSSIISRFTSKEPEPRCPTNEEIMHIKRLFFDDDEAVVEIIPAKGNQTPWHPIARHLWHRTFSEFPMPLKTEVGAN